ncbi:fumarylacetoacetate hydrolase family protein [Sphingomonas sp. RIT328]|uniref:fumarylacetoacetate hydrolase family protein n=1 Tax=Sphingomonas sp. RIT328 TaxID=1470591 RepID=UPI000450B72E|nr:fumarylacetoacetate hydrolase family protein [Sphingomonas sp. RIT328]EZP50455.1 putative bifunctional enzyme 2-hydroxyhepta-2,4-diene-1,7-dioatesomerase [Sphingomonas sp. RIT328]
MKFCRFGAKGAEKPGLVDAQGRVRDLSAHVPDITVDALPRLVGIDPETLPLADAGVRYGVPLTGVGKIVAIGLNYRDHAIESNLPIPTEPVMFLKAVTSLSGPDDDVVLPEGATHGDWEVELGVVIGQTCRYVEQADALDHVAGYVLANDVSERFDQKQRGSQWSKGKSHDTFCPVGPWLVTADEIGDPQALDMRLDLNGERMQSGNTRTMIFGVAELIAYVSRYVTLLPGDIMITGTPPGVGEGKRPEPVFLAPGDVMSLAIDGLGTQRQRVVAFDRALLG